MDKRKNPRQASPQKEKDEPEVEPGHTTPGSAEGDLETVEQDLEMKEQGGPMP